VGVLKGGHKNAILEVRFSPAEGERLYTGGADRQLVGWDTRAFVRARKFKGHQGIVSAVAVQHQGGLLVSGGDDMSARVWDERAKHATAVYALGYPVTAVGLTGEYAFIGGLDNTVKAVNRRKGAVEWACIGHTDTVTGLAISPDGKTMATNAMDNTVRVWDVRPFVINNDDSLRCLHTLQGATHNFERNLLRVGFNWDGSLVTAGSADRFVNVWDIAGKREGQLVQKLGGHQGSVNEVVFNPNAKYQNWIASASSDKTIVLGELQEA
jgi:Prp8 binding protein